MRKNRALISPTDSSLNLTVFCKDFFNVKECGTYRVTGRKPPNQHAHLAKPTTQRVLYSRINYSMITESSVVTQVGRYPY